MEWASPLKMNRDTLLESDMGFILDEVVLGSGSGNIADFKNNKTKDLNSNQNNRDLVGSDYLDINGNPTGTEIVNDEMYIVGYGSELWKKDLEGNFIF